MPIVNAYGRRINFPDDMSHEEIANVISANEKDLNPDYKAPESGGVRSFIENNILGFSTKEKPSIAEQAEATADEGANTAAPQVKGAPVRQSFYNKALLDNTIGAPITERFRKPDREGVMARIRKAANEDIKGQEQQREIEGLRTDGVVPEGGFVASAKAMAGQTIKGAGQLGSDYLGADKDNALIKYGDEILRENPTVIKSLSDIKDQPFMAFKEASGNMVPSFGAMLGTAVLGQGIISVAPLTGPLAPVVAAVGAGVKWLGPAAIAALPSYGSIRDKQIFNDKANEDSEKAKAIALLGASAVGAIEVAFGPQNWAISMMTKEGRAALARKFAATTPLEAFMKGGLLGGASEGAEELVQNPIEQLSSFENPLTKKNIEETKFGGAMGFIGGFAPGGITNTANYISQQAQIKADRINAERAKLGLDKIVKSTTVDEAINAANESVSQRPVDKDDVLRVADPTLADIERLTGLKPSESIQEAERQQSILSQAQQENNATQSDIEGQNNRKPKTPRDTEIVLPDNKTLNAQWDIVDADNVKASLKNGESQPRDRTRAASDLQVQSIAKNPDYRRLSDSPVMDIGAPVLSNDGKIVGGNGRFEAISRAYDQGSYQEYLDNLKEDAIRKGIDPAVIDQMKKPVLVRRITQPFDTRQLAIASNSGMSAQYSDLEQARLDSERLKGLEDIITTDNGDIALTADNIRRVRDALGNYSPAEIAPFVDANGQLSQQGMKRIRNAMLAKAYGDNQVIQGLIESNDSDIRNILGALTRVVGDVIKAKANAPKESDITPSILEAVNIYNQLRQQNKPVSSYLQQQDAFAERAKPAVENVLMFLDKNARSQPKLTDFFREAYTKLGSIDAKTADIFGEEVKPKAEDLFAKPTIESQLEKHLKKNGYEFDVKPVTEREFNSLDESKKAQKELAEKQAKIFGKKVVFVKTKGKFGINGVMVPAIKDTIFIDLNTPKPFHAVMAHELSHWMEQENPKAYKDMLAALKDIIVNEDGYRRKYNIDDQTEGLIPREIAGDLMGDNFTKPEFWKKVAEYNPSKFKEIAQNIIKWLKNIILKAKARGMGSEEWVTDAKKAQDIIAKAVSQYTKEQDAEGGDVKFNVTGDNDEAIIKARKLLNNLSDLYSRMMDQINSKSKDKSLFLEFGEKSLEAKDILSSMLESGKLNGIGIDGKSLLSRNTSSNNPWRITFFSPVDGEPVGHNEYSSAKQALNDSDLIVRSKDKEKIALFSRAYHGSPHDHDRFDSSKIGTGEGAQAYGYGHYFADTKEVAEYYKKQLSYNGLQSLQDELFDLGLSNYSATRYFAGELISHKGDMRKAADALKRHAESFKNHNRYGEYDELINTHKEVEGIITGGVTKLNVDRSQGKLYEVELAPKQDEYLLWDKPLSEQSEKVKVTIMQNYPKYFKGLIPTTRTGGYFYQSESGSTVIPGEGSQKALSERLHSLGIRGIKYLDQGSRGAGEGTYNYVVFDDKDVEIKAKFSKQEHIPETINIDGIERPTRNSEGRLIHSTEIGIRKFWKWFGNSKVVDDKGRPLVVYHASNLKAKARGMGSEEWVTDAKKAQDIIAKAVSQYTESGTNVNVNNNINFSGKIKSGEDARNLAEKIILSAKKSRIEYDYTDSKSFGSQYITLYSDGGLEKNIRISDHASNKFRGSDKNVDIDISPGGFSPTEGIYEIRKFFPEINIRSEKVNSKKFLELKKLERNNLEKLIIRSSIDNKNILPGDFFELLDNITESKDIKSVNKYKNEILEKLKQQNAVGEKIEFKKNENKEVRLSKQEKEQELEDYRMEHKSPGREGNAPLSDLTGDGNIYPDDVYSAKAVQYYGTGNDVMDRQSFNKAKLYRGKPDAMVDIYRAVPKGVADKINPGDWVTINKSYAKEHGESYFDGKYDILTKKVRAGDIFTNGDSIHEWGYEPEDTVKLSKQQIPDTIKELEKSWDAKGISNFISEKDGIITLSKIVIPKEQRNNGIGTSAMNELIDYADRTSQRIALTPSSDFGGSKSRLLSFYRRFGFVENRGKNKDYSISESMYRDSSVQAQVKDISSQIPETITINGIERPTRNSEGKLIHPTKEGIRKFWKWFGDSKVVDDQGRPLVVYHASNENFNEFDENKRGKNYTDSASVNNFFFSSDKEDALYFGTNVKEFYLKSNRLKKITDNVISSEADMWLRNLRDSNPDEYDFQINTKQYQNSDGINKGYELAIQDAVSGGYESTVYENEYGIKWFTVKNPNQIKSAIDNNGEFSEDSNDIRFSKTELDEFGEFKTGVPVTFNYLHNKESATELLGIPKNREDRFGRFYEPSGKYIIATDDDYLAKSNPKQYEFGQTTFNNPLVIKNNDLGWKKELSDKYDGLRGKNLSKALIADGYDGVVTVDKYGTSEILDLTSFDESKAKFSQQKPFNPNEDIPETKAQKAQRIGQDKFNRFKVIKEWLAKEKGINLSEAADVYGAEERYYGKVANQQEDFREKIRNPLIEKISKAGYKLDDVEQYLLNRHAQEANAQNRKLTGKEDSTAYGISDADAKEYLAKAPKELAKLADEVQALTDKAQQLRLDNGIETDERVNAMKSAYQYYVPVRGDAESQQKQNQYKGTGKGFSMKYKPKRRLGHELRNEGVIENIFQDYERAIMQVEKNRIGKSLALMAAEIQMPELISIDQPVKRKVLQNQKAYGVLVKGELQDVFQTEEAAKQNKQLLVATDKKLTLSDITISPITDQRLIYSASPMLADNEVLVYMNGHEIRLQINDELLARAYKNMGTEALGNILSAGRAINGWMSKAYTGYNPEFILTNLIRDFTSGIINLTGEQGLLMAAKAVANYPKSFASLLKYAFNGKSDKWIDAYRDNGGNTGAAYLPDLERLGEEVKREYASYQGVIANLKEGDSANALRAAGRKAFNATLKYINHLNAAGENAFRLATFKAMVESGKSVNEAASMAKNVTVNFNRKGEMGAELNALYLFFNASLQGTAATSHALFKGRHKYQAWGLSGAMMAVGYTMASMLGGFDDEDKYDEIGDATKSRNLIMSYGDGYVKIPVPYGYGFFYNAGRMYAEAQRKGEIGKMPYQLMALATEEFSPFNVASTEDSEFSSKKVYYGLLPTMLKVPAEITNNYSSFANRELYPEKTWYQFEPDNEKMWRGTKGTVYDISAQYLASIGIEISPEVLKYMTRTATGGSGAFVDSVVSGAMLKSQGAELEAREIPFARKFYGENTIQDARARYGKAKEEARIAFEKFNALKKKNDIESVRNFVNDKKELLALNSYANKLSDVIKNIRDQQDLIKLSDKYTTAEKRLKIKELENQEKKYYDMFMKQYKTVKH